MDLFSEGISEVLCQYVQILAGHFLIVSLTRGTICICIVHGSGLSDTLFGRHGFLFELNIYNTVSRRRQTISVMKLKSARDF